MSAGTSSDPVGQGPAEFQRALGPSALIGLGVGGIIGAGIFVMAGVAAHDVAGPSVILSFVIAAIACCCTGLCYGELASMYPSTGSAFVYAHRSFGRACGWLVGWSLVLQYAIAAASVSQGWSHYLQAILTSLGLHFPAALSSAPIDLDVRTGVFHPTGRSFDLLAALLVVGVTAVVVRGIRLSLRVNIAVLFLKLTLILLVIVIGCWHIHPANWWPFAPFGWGIRSPAHGSGHPTGMIAGAAIAFYAYLGFEVVSILPEEARNPRRDVPIAIIGALAVCTLLYVAVAIVLTGMTPYNQISVQAPISDAFRQAGMPWAERLIGAGVVIGLTSVVLVILLCFPRVLFAVAREGLLPERLVGGIHPRFQTPWRASIVGSSLVLLLAALTPLRALADVVAIAALSTFIVVAASVLWLRHREPLAERPYRTPFGPLVPMAAIAVSGLMLMSVAPVNWLLLAIWMAPGILIYLAYGRPRRAESDQPSGSTARSPAIPGAARL